MKLTIDTQVDTYEDIRKILHILTSILEKKDSDLTTSSSTASADTTNLMSMFSDTPASKGSGTVETSGNPPDFSSFLSLTQKKEQKDNDEGQIEYY